MTSFTELIDLVSERLGGRAMAEEMLDLCRGRLHNDPETELAVAVEEQRKITRLRLEELFAS